MSKGIVAVLYPFIAKHAGFDEQDVLSEVRAVANSLKRLDYTPVRVMTTLNLDATIKKLRRLDPVLIFNLIEGIAGEGRFSHIGALLGEYLHLPFTGGSSSALMVADNKLLQKKLMREAGLPIPEWTEKAEPPAFGGPYIVKSAIEHGSFQLNPASVVASPQHAQVQAQAQAAKFNHDWLIERYIAGREFNIGLIERDGAPQILSVAEMQFKNFVASEPKFRHYDAKWYQDKSQFPAAVPVWAIKDLNQLRPKFEELARRAWQALNLQGYARLDVRLDEQGQVWILEMNLNFCISRDAGFLPDIRYNTAPYDEFIQKIIDAGLNRASAET